MSMLATIAKPAYDNSIKAAPAGSAFAYSASTGVLDANFGATIGTTDAIQLLTQGGYTFGWRPDTVNVIDTAGNLTLLDNVNAGATAQVWQNKISYVGTTGATSDEFTVDGQRLKHDVRMVAPPTLPSGYAATPQYLAIGGDIGTTSADWADVELWADGAVHTTTFSTTGALSFRLISSSKEIYNMPAVTITDDAGNVQTGGYLVEFGANNAVTLYTLAPWDWMQQAQYPVVIDPTVVVNSAYNTSGSGQKEVRLSNGWIVVAVKNYGANNQVAFYVSKDNGQTWALLAWGGPGDVTEIALASSGTTVYAVGDGRLTLSVQAYDFDATTVSSTNELAVTGTIADTSTGSYQIYQIGPGVGLAIDGSGALHATWSAEEGSYSNAYNVWYAKSTDGGATWTAPLALTTLNTTNYGDESPALVVTSGNLPMIIFQDNQNGSDPTSILLAVYSGSAWANHIVYTDGYGKYSPDMAIDSNGTLHAVWSAFSASATSTYNIYYAKSTDGGTTWSSPTALTSETTANYNQQNAKITVEPSNNLYVFFQGVDSAISTTYDQIRYIKYNATAGTWGSVVSITNNTTASAINPQLLWSEFNMNSSDALRAVYEDTQAGAVEYYAIPLDNPPNAPILNTEANFDATTAQWFSWTFSDPDPGDSQSAFELQIYDVAAASTVVDTGKMAFTTSTYQLAANTLTNGKQYQWRVTTWDSSGEQGPYSAYATFNTAAAPKVTITSPAAGATDATSSETVQWSFSDPASNTQQSFRVKLLDSTDATVLWDSGTMQGSGNQLTIGYTLANNTTYHIQVTTTSSAGIASNTSDVSFSTSFTPPNNPTASATVDSANAAVDITWTNPAGTTAVSYNRLYKQVSGQYQLRQDNLTGTRYTDYQVGNAANVVYGVSAMGSNGVESGITQVTATPSFTGDWLYNPITGQQFQFIYNRQKYNMATQEERKEFQTFGDKPMVRRGPLNARQGTLQALMVQAGSSESPVKQLQAFEADMSNHYPYYLKTAAGEVFKVDLHNYKRQMPVENLNTQAIGLSVDWTEVS